LKGISKIKTTKDTIHTEKLIPSLVKLSELTPPEIVKELDKYIVGQNAAKRAVAIALRNRYRRQKLSDEMRDEIAPKNIMMIGPTGVGKTEIARRMARLIDAPFIKVEATKFTEVGYVGRDVESIVRDLFEISFKMVHDLKLREVHSEAERQANEKLVNYLVQQLYYKDKAKARAKKAEMPDVIPPAKVEELPAPETVPEKDSLELEFEAARQTDAEKGMSAEELRRLQRRKRRVASMLKDHKLEDQTIEIDLDNDEPFGFMEFVAGLNTEEQGENFNDFMENLGSLTRRRSRRVPVKEARRILVNEEANKLIDFEGVVEDALSRTEQLGVVFVDEIDKIVGNGNENGPDVSGEGVQRDLLPIVEGSTVMTRYGPIKTDYILFIAAGAFHNAKPSDLIPELQGRFPLRVELDSLEKEDLKEILTKPENALTKQYTALLDTEGVSLGFEESGLDEIARIAWEVNTKMEDIGARRLHTIMERVLEDISFSAAEHTGETVTITGKYVVERVGDLIEDEDLSKFIL
jgi:ATP-dependent HslUV protease ATP-binding subunit HslU